MSARPVADDEIVVRRFDPDDPRHWTHDDSGQVGTLRSSALIFHADSENSPDEKNCSVYEETKLVAAGLDRWGALEKERPDWGVATIRTRDVKEFSRDKLPAPNPFDVVEDAYPDGPEGAHIRDSAHAVITYSVPTPGADKWCRDLALRFVAERRSA